MEPAIQNTSPVPVVVLPSRFKQSTNAQLLASRGGDVQSEDVQEVVMVTAVGCEEVVCESAFEVEGSAFQSGAEIAAEEEVSGEQKNRLEMMLAGIEGLQEVAEHKQWSPKKHYFSKSRRGRQKRRWGTKTPAKTYKRHYLESECSEVKEDMPYDEYTDREEYGRMMRREAKKRLFAHRLQWSNRNMENAMKDVQERNMTLRGAAKRNSVPYSTLKDRIQGRVIHGTKPGVKTVLSPEEESELVTCIQQLEGGGFQLHCGDIRELARQMLMIRVSRGFSTPYRNGCPGHNWYAGFLKRHPGIQIKRLLNKNVVLSTTRQKHMLKRFFDILSHNYRKMQVVHKPDNVFTVAELKISAYPHAVAIIAASARGVPLPPFVVLRGTAVDSTKPAVFNPPEYKEACFFNSRGRRDEDIMLYWFRDHFLRCMPYQRGRPVILLMSRAVSSDMSLRLVQLAADESVSLICLPHGISHLLQPMSSNILRAVDSAISSNVERLCSQGRLTSGLVLTPSSLALVLSSTWNNEWPTTDVNLAFAESGIFPLNVRAITMERIVSSTPEDIDTNSDTRDQIMDSEDGDDSTDDAEHGLNLLSELSTREQMQDVDLASCLEIKKPLRQRADDSYYDSVYSNINRRRREPNVSDELMKRILGEPAEQEDIAVGSSRTRPSSNPSSRKSDVRDEIAAARNNYDQINRAVDSIVSERSGNGAVKRRPGRPRVKPDQPQYGRLLKQSNSARASSHSSVKLENNEVEIDTDADVSYLHVDPSNSSAQWLSTDVGAESTPNDRKDVIEEVDLSDLYVNVDDGSARLSEHGASNNNTKSATVASPTVVHCDIRQLASQLRPDQTVDVIQNIVIGGRTLQIIRRLTFEDVMRQSAASIDTSTEETVPEIESEVVELDIAEQTSSTECVEYL